MSFFTSKAKTPEAMAAFERYAREYTKLPLEKTARNNFKSGNVSGAFNAFLAGAAWARGAQFMDRKQRLALGLAQIKAGPATLARVREVAGELGISFDAMKTHAAAGGVTFKTVHRCASRAHPLRTRVIDFLKANGPQRSSALIAEFGTTAMNLIFASRAQGRVEFYVAYYVKHRHTGRPTPYYAYGKKGDAPWPKTTAEIKAAMSRGRALALAQAEASKTVHTALSKVSQTQLSGTPWAGLGT